MFHTDEILSTIQMPHAENLNVRTVTLTLNLDHFAAPKAGDPKKGELDRRYSNFGHYVDRQTGEIVLLVAEEPRATWDDYWSDTIRFRIKL